MANFPSDSPWFDSSVLAAYIDAEKKVLLTGARVHYSIIQACSDPGLFGPWFRNRKSWVAWMTFLKALFALPMNSDDRKVYRECTGRTRPPQKQMTEAWLIVGRRGGKSLLLATIAVYLACFRDYRPFLQPGEKGTIIIIATDKPQARTIFRYIMGFLNNIPVLKKLITSSRAMAVELDNHIVIEVHAGSFRTVRGYTFVAGLFDEIAFWRSDDSSNPDTEIIDAVKPGMATIPGAMLLCASSPYAKRGALYKAYTDHYAKNVEDVLVWKAPTWIMHPTINKRFLERQYERDPLVAEGEFGANFRADVESLIAPESIDAVTVPGRIDVPYAPGTVYFGFVDPSGGSQDSYTAAITHYEAATKRGVLDAVREIRPPFDPDHATAELANFFEDYRISHVNGDRYAGMWPKSKFGKCNIIYDVIDQVKSELYSEFVVNLNSKRMELLDLPRIKVQFTGLERKTGASGKDTIDHSPGGKDDLANAIAGSFFYSIPKKLVDYPDSYYSVSRPLVSAIPGIIHAAHSEAEDFFSDQAI